MSLIEEFSWKNNYIYYYYCSLFYSTHLAWTLLFFPNKQNDYLNRTSASLLWLVCTVFISRFRAAAPLWSDEEEEEEPSAVCCTTTRGHTFPLLARTQLSVTCLERSKKFTGLLRTHSRLCTSSPPHSKTFPPLPPTPWLAVRDKCHRHLSLLPFCFSPLWGKTGIPSIQAASSLWLYTNVCGRLFLIDFPTDASCPTTNPPPPRPPSTPPEAVILFPRPYSAESWSQLSSERLLRIPVAVFCSVRLDVSVCFCVFMCEEGER